MSVASAVPPFKYAVGVSELETHMQEQLQDFLFGEVEGPEESGFSVFGLDLDDRRVRRRQRAVAIAAIR